MISDTRINKAFDDYIKAFNELASKEDELETMRAELEEYKDGSSKYVAAQKAVHDFEHAMIEYQRKLRLAGIEVDRIKTLSYVDR